MKMKMKMKMKAVNTTTPSVEKKRKKSDAGFIFMCNGRTKPECYRFRVFGLPRGQLNLVKDIKPGAKLFLYDFDVKLLYGVYRATSNGNLDLEPTAFSGKFPSQIRFDIFKECLPLRESAFKVAIRDNYLGFKFRQELSSTQVKDLISLFRPLTLTATTSDRPLLSNVATPHSFPQIMEQHPTVCGISSLQLPLPDSRSKQAVEAGLHDQYQPVASTQLPIKHWHAAHQQAALTCNADSSYAADVHVPYLCQRPSSSLQDPYGRYRIEHEIVCRNPIAEYPSEYTIPQMTNETERGIVSRATYAAGYYGQKFPSTAPHVSLKSQALPPSYTPPRPAGLQVEEPVSHEPYYPASVHENVNQLYADPLQRSIPGSSEANVPVRCHVSFAGAASTYRRV